MPKTSVPRSGSERVIDRGRTEPSRQVTKSAARPRSGLVTEKNRPADVVAFEDAVVSFFVDAADMLGVPKSVAAIYGICFASAEPLSFSEIDERLDISSGSISQGLRVLKEVGALKVVGHGPALSVIRDSEEPTDSGRSTSNEERITAARSAARYEPDLELRKLVLHWIERRLQAQLSSGRNRLQEICDSIPNGSATSLDTLKTRFESLQTWQDKAHSLLPIAKTFLKLT
jgi:DNA-binding transcriptional ArsR family regulator